MMKMKPDRRKYYLAGSPEHTRRPWWQCTMAHGNKAGTRLLLLLFVLALLAISDYRLQLYLALFFFGVSLLLTFTSIKLAPWLGFVGKPDGILKLHTHITPCLGGLAMYGTLALPLYFYAPFLLPGLTILFLTGLIDDRYRLSPGRLFLGHMLGACVLAISSPVPTIVDNGTLQFLLIFFWLVSLINSFNLIDVMDGLLGTACFIMSVAFGTYSYLLQQGNVTLLCVALSGAVAGFLYFNKPRAKIYMGDAGSLFLGGLFASLSLLLPWSASGLQFFLIPVALLCVPIGELLFLIGIRTYKGIPFFKGSPDHFSHYLKRKEWSVSGILSLSAFLNISAIILSFLYFVNSLSLYCYCASVAAVFLSFVTYLLY